MQLALYRLRRTFFSKCALFSEQGCSVAIYPIGGSHIILPEMAPIGHACMSLYLITQSAIMAWAGDHHVYTCDGMCVRELLYRCILEANLPLRQIKVSWRPGSRGLMELALRDGSNSFLSIRGGSFSSHFLQWSVADQIPIPFWEYNTIKYKGSWPIRRTPRERCC